MFLKRRRLFAFRSNRLFCYFTLLCCFPSAFREGAPHFLIRAAISPLLNEDIVKGFVLVLVDPLHCTFQFVFQIPKIFRKYSFSLHLTNRLRGSCGDNLKCFIRILKGKTPHLLFDFFYLQSVRHFLSKTSFKATFLLFMRINENVFKTLKMSIENLGITHISKIFNNLHALFDTFLHFEEVESLERLFFFAFFLHCDFAVFRLSSEQSSLHLSTRMSSSVLPLFSFSQIAVFFSFDFNFEKRLFSFDAF